jgi:hypothetical protein
MRMVEIVWVALFVIARPGCQISFEQLDMEQKGDCALVLL